MTARTICITLLASEWKSSKGGLSTMNRELAIQLAKLSKTSVSFLVPKCHCCDEDKREASNYNVRIVEAEERPGYHPNDWLTNPPEDLAIDFVVGHGVILGKQAQFIRKSHQCKWIQVEHTAPDELAVYKEHSSAISKGEEKQSAELKLCKMADLVVAVGPKLTEFYTALLNFCGKKVHNFTPGIFNQFASLNVSSIEGKKFRILVFGRGDTEDFKLKGYDIAANAVAKLDDKTYHLTFVGASKGSESHVNEELLKHGLLQSQLIVKGYFENREDLITRLCSSNLVIIPSRTEGFGLTALEALSAGIPFLVSQNSGFGEALQEIPHGSAFIVDSEDPEHWAEAIKTARMKGSETAFQECQELRALYAEKYNWDKQSDELLRAMNVLINEDDPSNQEQTSEYQLPKQTFQQNDSVTAPPASVATSAETGESKLHTFLPKRLTTKESVEKPNREEPEESTATQVRPTSQGARPKERNLGTTESAPKVIKGASRGKGMNENRTLHNGKDCSFRRVSESDLPSGIDPLQSDTFRNASPGGNTSLHTGKEGSFRRMGGSDHSVGMDPQQSDVFPSPLEKFEYQPKEKRSQDFATAQSSKADESTSRRRDPEEKRSTQGRYGSDVQRLDTLELKGKSMAGEPGMKENRALHTGKDGSSRREGESDPLQSGAFRTTLSRENTPFHTGKEGSSRRMGESDLPGGMAPLHSNAIWNTSPRRNASLYTGKEGSSRRMGKSDHSVGMDPLQSNAIWNTSPKENTSLYTGKEGSSRRMGKSDDSVGMDPLQIDVFPSPSPRGHASLYIDTPSSSQDLAPAKLHKTEQKDLSIIGWEAKPEAVSAVVKLIRRHHHVLSLGTGTDCLNLGHVNDVLSYFEHNPLKCCVLVADADKITAVLEQKGEINLRLLQSAERNVAKGIIITICCSWFLSEQDKSLVRSAIKKAFSDSTKVYITWFESGNLVLNPDDLISFLTSSNSFSQQQSAGGDCGTHGLTGNQPLKSQFPYPWDYKIYLPSGKTVLVITRIRNGKISNLQRDVQYWKLGFVVPHEIENDLFKRNSIVSNAELVILMTEKGHLACQVDKKNGKEWQNFITLGLDETIVLQTKLRHGRISCEPEDLVTHCEKWRVPQNEVNRLEETFRETPTADLFIASDSKGNSRSIVKVGSLFKVFTFTNTAFNQAVGKTVNLIKLAFRY